MPRELIQIEIVRKASTPDGAGGYIQSEIPVHGSPFGGRIFRRQDLNPSGFVTDTAGETNKDDGVIVSLVDPSACVQIDDIALVPGVGRLRVVRVRRYRRSLQCDTILGVD